MEGTGKGPVKFSNKRYERARRADENRHMADNPVHKKDGRRISKKRKVNEEQEYNTSAFLYFTDNMVKYAHHGNKTIPWTFKTLQPQDWNAMHYTQIEPNPKIKRGGPWTCNRKATTMLNAASNVIKGSEKNVLVFHGTSMKHLRKFTDGISLSRGSGCLGSGFYVTLDPTEALGYACRVSDASNDLLVIEMIVKQTDHIVLDESMTSQFGGPDGPVDHPGCFATRDPVVMSDFALHTQVCLKNIELVRIHVFDRKSVGAFPTYRSPGYQARFKCGEYYDQNVDDALDQNEYN